MLGVNDTGTQHLKSGGGERSRVHDVCKRWRNSLICKHRDEVDVGVTEPYIITGYREENQPWTYYLKSIFFPNNQAMNVWTHFVPFLCFLYRLFSFIQRTDDPLHIINFPYYVHGLGVCCALLTSSAAHTFCSHSTPVSRSCFGGDFAAIYQYGICFSVALESYVCPIQIYCGGPSAHRYFTYTTLSCSAAAALTLYINTVKRGASPYIRSIFYIIAMSVAYFPCVIKFGSGKVPTDDHPTSFVSSDHGGMFFFQLVCLSLACVFYVVRFPEVRYRGTFDFLGHSHHWFHLLSALSMYSQSLLLEKVLLELKERLGNGMFRVDHLGISWGGTFGVFFAALSLLSSVVAVYTYVMCYVIFKPEKIKTL